MATVAMPIAHAIDDRAAQPHLVDGRHEWGGQRRAVRDRRGVTRAAVDPAGRRLGDPQLLGLRLRHRVPALAFAPVRAVQWARGRLRLGHRLATGPHQQRHGADDHRRRDRDDGVQQPRRPGIARRLGVTVAQIDQRHRGRDACTERREPDPRAGTQQDAVGAIEVAGVQAPAASSRVSVS